MLSVTKFFLALTLFRVSLGLSNFLFSFLTHPPRSFLSTRVQKNKYLSCRRLYKFQAKISGHAVYLNLNVLKQCNSYANVRQLTILHMIIIQAGHPDMPELLIKTWARALHVTYWARGRSCDDQRDMQVCLYVCSSVCYQMQKVQRSQMQRSSRASEINRDVRTKQAWEASVFLKVKYSMEAKNQVQIKVCDGRTDVECNKGSCIRCKEPSSET